MESETVVLELPASLYSDIVSLAAGEDLEPAEVIARLVEAARLKQQSGVTTRAFRRILERATDLGVAGLAEQHDHHLHGVYKQ